MWLYAGAAIKHQTLYITQRMKNVIPFIPLKISIFSIFEVADLAASWQLTQVTKAIHNGNNDNTIFHVSSNFEQKPMKPHKRNTKFHFKGSFLGFWVQSCSMSRFQTCETRWCYHAASTSHFWLKIAQKVLFEMPKNPYKLISPQAGRHSEVCET